MTGKKPSNNPTWIDAQAMFLEVNPASQPFPPDDGGLDDVLRGILNERGIEGAEAEQIIRPNRDSKADERAWSLVCEIQKRNAKLIELGKNANQSNTERTATWDYEEKLQAEIEGLERELSGAAAVGNTSNEPTPAHMPMAVAQTEAPIVAGAGVFLPRPLQRQQAQDQAIMRLIRKEGHDPLQLPKNEPGKPGIKATVRKALQGETIFKGSTIFEKAWERLRNRKEIAEKP